MNNQETKDKLKIANPGARFVAYAIDILIGMAILELFILSVISASEVETLLNNLLKILIFLIFFFSVITPLVNSLLISKLGGTLGKLLTGIRIVNEKGQNLSFLRAFFRNYIGYLVSKVLVMLGFIWILVDKQRRGWHDLITGSWVIVTNKLGFFMGIVVMITLLGLDVFLGNTVYQEFKQNKNFYYGIFDEMASEIEDSLQKELKSQEQPVELYDFRLPDDETYLQTQKFNITSNETKLLFNQGKYEKMLNSAKKVLNLAQTPEKAAIANYWLGLSNYKQKISWRQKIAS